MFWSESPNVKGHSEDLDVDGKILGKWGVKMWPGFMWIRTMAGFVNTAMNLRVP
jgi:hypothetical protein